jgi:hypothetical protein
MAMLDDTKEASRAITPKARENMMPNGQSREKAQVCRSRPRDANPGVYINQSRRPVQDRMPSPENKGNLRPSNTSNSSLLGPLPLHARCISRMVSGCGSNTFSE